MKDDDWFGYLRNGEYQNYAMAIWLVEDKTFGFRQSYRHGKIKKSKKNKEAYLKIQRIINYLQLRKIEVL